jgi:hypothetical protein
MATNNSSIFLAFDVNIEADQDTFDVRIRIPEGQLLTLRTYQVELFGNEDFELDRVWCLLNGDGKSMGVNDGGLRITVDGNAPERLFTPRIVLNHVVASGVPDGRFYVIGPSNIHLPVIESLRIECFRYPSTKIANAVVSLTGTIEPYTSTD